MSDLNWCTYCDNAISQHSSSLYCSEKCLREDALNNHPLLGYQYPEFKDFPRLKSSQQQQSQTMDLNSHNDSNTDDDEEEDDDDNGNSNTQMKMKMESNRKPVDDQSFRLETVLPDSHHQQKQSTNYHYFSYDDNHSLL